jgi:hypothetical protein
MANLLRYIVSGGQRAAAPGRNRGRVLSGDRYGGLAGRAHGHLVEQGHGVEDGHQVVIAVVPRRPHGKLQIHLRGNPDGHSGHGRSTAGSVAGMTGPAGPQADWSALSAAPRCMGASPVTAPILGQRMGALARIG